MTTSSSSPAGAPGTVLPGAPPRELVVAVRPSLGWERATTGSRCWAVLALAMLVGWPAAMLVDPVAGDGVAMVSGFFLGPPAFYSLARVLRPRRDPEDGRRERHVLASVGSSYGTAAWLSVWLGDGASAYVLGTPAFLALVVTLPWAVLALLARVARTPVPRGPRAV